MPPTSSFAASLSDTKSSTPPAATAVGVDRARAFVEFLAEHPTLRSEMVNMTFPSRREAAAYIMAKAGQMGFSFTVGDYKALVRDVMSRQKPTIDQKAKLLHRLGAPKVTYLEVPYRSWPEN